MTNNMNNIADLLPEGLSEESVGQIASLVNDIIVEEVEDRIKNLENKVKSFMRLKIDEMKGQALAELQQDNEMVRSAHLF